MSAEPPPQPSSSSSSSSHSASSSSDDAPHAKPEPATFALGELVWAKMDAHCAWPAQVVHPQGDYAAREIRKRKHANDKHLVFFFGDHTFAWYPSAVRLLDFESNYAQFCKRSKSKSFQLALREAAREKERLAREGEAFGYRVINDDELSDSSSSSSASASPAPPPPPAETAKRRRPNTVSRGRGRKRAAATAASGRRPSSTPSAAAVEEASGSSDDESGSSSSTSVPHTTLPDESDLSTLLPGKDSPLETAAARWAATRLQMAMDTNEWAVVLVLLARLTAMSATLDALRLSGVGKQVKRASKAPHAATAAKATQLMGRWAELVRNTLKQSTDVISHTGHLKESTAELSAGAADEVAAAPPPPAEETTAVVEEKPAEE